MPAFLFLKLNGKHKQIVLEQKNYHVKHHRLAHLFLCPLSDAWRKTAMARRINIR